MSRLVDDTWTELLVLQPTPFCNINCTYCYLPARTDRRRMSAAVLDATFRGVLQSRFVRNELTVVWHAGEPLALPPDWYEAAFARDEPDALFDFYVANGIRRVAFNIEETEGANSGSSLAGPVQEARFRAFLRRFFARMRREPEAIVLREWERAVAVIGARGTAPYG